MRSRDDNAHDDDDDDDDGGHAFPYFPHYLRYCRAAGQRTSERTRQGCERIAEGRSNRTNGRPTVSCSRFPSSHIQVQAFIGRSRVHREAKHKSVKHFSERSLS